MGSVQKIASGMLWTTITRVINIVYGFFSVPILLGYFGQSQYGLIGLAVSINVYIQLMDMGLNSTNVRFYSTWLANDDKDKTKKGFQTSLAFYSIIGLLNAIILLALSFFTSTIFNVSPEQSIILKKLIYILAANAIFGWFSGCFDQLIRASENVAWIQKRALIPKILNILILIATIVFKLELTNYFFLITFAYLTVFPLTIRKIQKEVPFIKFSPKFDRQILKEILPYSLNIFSFSIFQFSYNNLRPVFLGIQGTVESVADYNIIMGITNVALLISGSSISSLLPSTSRIVAQKNKEAYYRVAYDGTKYLTILLCFCSFGLIAICPELLTLYIGEQYSYLIPWLVTTILCNLGWHNQAISCLILSGSDVRAINYSSAIAAATGLIVTWFTIPTYQVGGPILGMAAYMLIQLSFYYWFKIMHLSTKIIFFQSFIPYVLIGGIGVLISRLFTLSHSIILNLIIIGVAFTIIYLVLTFFTLSKTDKSFINSLIPYKYRHDKN